jgi:DNA repair protein RecN (Recombination protein N)
MLRNLIVENYALISKLEIEFRNGLTIITGETGAGKSILLGAMSLILGKRADSSVLLDKNKKCVVEGTFDIAGYGLEPYLTENGIDYDDHTLLRREISVSGKSRAFINDTPVTLEVLSGFGSQLIDIHSQHHNLHLATSQFQMTVIDNYARNNQILEEYGVQFRAYRDAVKKHAQLAEDSGKLKSELDYLQFQFRQLDEARLKVGEQESLEQELEKLTHAEEIKSGLSAALLLLEGETTATLQQLKECTLQIHRIGKYLPNGDALYQRLETAYIDLKDLTREISQLNDLHDPDPNELTSVNDRLNALYSLQKKHRVSSVEELVLLREQLRVKIEEIQMLDFNLDETEKELLARKEKLTDIALEIRRKRLEVIAPFEKKIIEMMREVGIPNAGFKVQQVAAEDFTDRGTDRIQFLFSANKNLAPQEISRIASGGELSRLMLCIKSLLVDASGLPTLIFDEIDSGISGDIAERVGNIINRMAEKMQIINVTHLPQVASKGQHHYLIYKTDEEHSSATHVKLLTPEERHLEIAKMLSGEEVTHAALENAKALLGN